MTRMATPEWAHGWPQGWGLQAVKDGTAGPAMTNGTPAPHSVPLPGGVHGDQVPHWQVCLGHGRHRPCPACVLLSADLCAVDGPPLWVAPAAWPPPSCCSPALKAFEKATATLTRLLAPLPGWPAPEACCCILALPARACLPGPFLDPSISGPLCPACLCQSISPPSACDMVIMMVIRPGTPTQTRQVS